MSEHRIRLRGPWKLSLPHDLASHRVTLPNLLAIPLNLADQEIKLTRDFNWLAQLEPDDQALLEIKGAVGLVRARLNQQELVRTPGNQPAMRFVCTSMLEQRNQLELYFVANTQWNANELGERSVAIDQQQTDGESSKLEVGVGEEVELVIVSR